MKKKRKTFVLADLKKDKKIREQIRIETAFEEIENLVRIPVKTQTILTNIERALGTTFEYEEEIKQIEKIIEFLRDKAIKEVENADV